MNQSISISLVIPTYNRAALVVETVRSALAQTVPFAEILVVDDASTDDTVARLRAFGGQVRVIEAPKAGVQAARNLGARAAASQYITFCDSDDLLRPAFVEQAAAFLSRRPEYDSVYFNYQSFSGDKIEKDILAGAPAKFLAGARYSENFIEHIPDLYARTAMFQPLMPSGATVRKAFYEKIGGFNPAFNKVPSEDWEYTLRAIAHGKTAICLDPLVLIRRHGGNDSRDWTRQTLGEIEILKYALQHHDMAKKYEGALMESIHKRRHKVFYESFRSMQLSVAALVFPLLENPPATLRFKVKSLVMSAYLALRKPDSDFLYRR